MSEIVPERTASPFHKGEMEIQERVGIRDKMEMFGPRMIQNYMSGAHRDFFKTLPFVLAGTVDGHGLPWASMLVGNAGFAYAPDPRLLSISANPLFGDPLSENLKVGAQIGMLGIDLSSRRRIRVNGRIQQTTSSNFDIRVAQSFRNCPQYIQARQVEILPLIDAPDTKQRLHQSSTLGDVEQQVILRADTFFMATTYSENQDDPSHGVDVSHRGGKPGFVRVDDDHNFIFPDFGGNRIFNSLGNILLNPRAGFLFPNFETGDLLYLSGRAEIIWEGKELDAFVGAERLVRCAVEKVIYVEESLPLRFNFESFSPVLENTGSWQQASETY